MLFYFCFAGVQTVTNRSLFRLMGQQVACLTYALKDQRLPQVFNTYYF